MHPPAVKAEALRLVGLGLNDCEISRRIDVPRRTIMDWRRRPYTRKNPVMTCPRCGGASPPIRFNVDDYVELLAMYLGDGCISTHPRTYRLRISLDTKYPGIISDCRDLLARIFPENLVDIVKIKDKNCVSVSVYSQHLPCLLPQHGPGIKHHRPIKPELWQWALIASSPWPFIRGCIRTDGCVFVNRTGPYEYLSYSFANKSRDIALMLSLALDMAGVQHRLTDSGRRQIWQLRINRRDAVAKMLKHAGVKE